MMRYFLRLVLGRARTGRLPILQRFWLGDYFSPSFHVARITNELIKTLRIARQPFLVKVAVPKYACSYYCRIIDFSPGREQDIIQHFSPVQGNVVIDVGAHVGRYTILGSKLVGQEGKVIAIEAHPSNFQLLQRNLHHNKLDNVIAFNCAAYSEDGVNVRLFMPDRQLGSTIYNTVMEKRDATNKFVSVPALRLDSIVQHSGIRDDEVNWMKIDVEGAEYEVLKGAEKILRKSKEISVLVEVHNLNDGNFYNAIVDTLKKNEFSIVFEKIYDRGERHIILRKLAA
jgi:FkbM family methyltransferase